MIDLHQGTTGEELRGAGASVLGIVLEQAQVFRDLANLRLVGAARRQMSLNVRLAQLAVARARQK